MVTNGSIAHIFLTALWVGPLVVGIFYVLGKVFALAEKTHERVQRQKLEDQVSLQGKKLSANNLT